MDKVSNTKKFKIPAILIILPCIIAAILICLMVVLNIFKNNVNKQRWLVLEAKEQLLNDIDSYNSSIVPFLMECSSLTGDRGFEYDDVLNSKKLYDSSDDKIVAFNTLKSSVDKFIIYTESDVELVNLNGYKNKLEVLIFYDGRVANSLDVYNKLVDNYSSFIKDIKYRFISDESEFKTVD